MYRISVTYADLFAFEADLRHVGLLESIVNRSENGNWKKFEIKLSLTAVEDLWRLGVCRFCFGVGDTTLKESCVFVQRVLVPLFWYNSLRVL